MACGNQNVELYDLSYNNSYIIYRFRVKNQSLQEQMDEYYSNEVKWLHQKKQFLHNERKSQQNARDWDAWCKKLHRRNLYLERVIINYKGRLHNAKLGLTYCDLELSECYDMLEDGADKK